MQKQINTRAIAVLLATYNGESYLEPLLQSLIEQKFQDFSIFVHDDGSNDGTLQILNGYIQKYDFIHLLHDSSSGRGAKDSFFWLLEQVESRYYMFCDQDDVWLDHKIGDTYARMCRLEQTNKDLPILVFSDLTVVDESLNIQSNSMWEISKINPLYSKSSDYLSIHNFVTGCTMMINRCSVDFVLPVSRNALMHDSWIALSICSKGGVIDYISEPLMLYRQHSNNAIGASTAQEHRLLRKLFNIRRVIKENYATFTMVNDIRKMPFVCYFYYKIKYFLLR